VTLTDETFPTLVLESPHPVRVACGAAGCGPWQRLAPEMAAVAEACRGRATVATLDVDAQPQTSPHDGMHTRPTVLCFHAGKVVAQFTGVVDRADLVTTLHALTGTGQS
jgi:thioredoxin 1